MTPPTEPNRTFQATEDQATSIRCDADETVPGSDSAAGPPAAPGFGPPVEPGEVGTLGPYRVVKELGKGGMGAVYAAVDTRLTRRIALKVMLPQLAANPSAKERFLREARAAAGINHDHVVTIYEADERQGVAYIAMEYLEGCPLDEFLKRKGNPTGPQTVRVAREVAAGLAAAHKVGLVHRDIKPANLWLEAPNGRVKVLDFGLAKAVDSEIELSSTGAVVGTPAYMSPEQARGEKVDHRTDLFSLGAVLYRLTTGKLPFEGPSTMAVLMALATQDPPPVRDLNPAVSEPLAGLIRQLLSKDPADRPASAEEVLRRLRAIAGEIVLAAASAKMPPLMANVPIRVTDRPTEANPFANLNSAYAPTEEMTEPVTPAPAVAGRKAGGSWRWPAIGLAALLPLIIGGVIIVIKNKDGTETKIEVPDGATVTVKGNDGKTLGTFGPDQPKATAATDREVAEWVLSIGGAVHVNGKYHNIKAAADLPNEVFILTGVFLGGNKQVTDAGLAQLKDCKGLLILALMETGVTDAGLSTFKDCKKLMGISLNGTKVTDAGLANFKDCKDLVHLSLTGTKVTDAGLANFKDCKGLRDLALNNTKVTDAGLANFKDCKGLRELHLLFTGVTDAGLANFTNCKGLKFLDLGGTKVTDTGLEQLKDCKELTALYLGGTEMSDAGLANFKDCKGLLTLHMIKTKVTDAGLAYFKDCKELANLDVRETKVTAAGLTEFHAAVPGCRIEHDRGIIEPKK